jgi:Uma2 family endonuclease
MIATATNLFEGIETALDSLPEGSQVERNDVSWEDYEQLLEDVSAERYFKIYFDNGKLTAMTISYEHEGLKACFPHLIAILTDELDLPLFGAASTTLKKSKKKKGGDPDDSYYIENADRIQGLKRINLATDPPPDLVIEVDITSSSTNKFAIYAAMGVPEFWRYDESEMRFYKLEGEDFVEVEVSPHFTFLTPAIVEKFLALGLREGITKMNRAFREWVKTNKPA